jgi:hypothetical protein
MPAGNWNRNYGSGKDFYFLKRVDNFGQSQLEGHNQILSVIIAIGSDQKDSLRVIFPVVSLTTRGQFNENFSADWTISAVCHTRWDAWDEIL